MNEEPIRASEVEGPKVTDEELEERQRAKAAAVRKVRREVYRRGGATGVGSTSLAGSLEERIRALNQKSFDSMRKKRDA
jgi:hypothetical protein